MIQLTYKGVDITDSVSINRCYHDMYAAGRSDELHLRVNDTQNLWDRWGPTTGDEIRVDYGPISTGTMFISAATPMNGVYDIVAQSAPASGFTVRSKAWQKVRLLQLVKEVADANGLSFSSYGVTDVLYPYMSQNEESDFRFLYRVTQLEGCSFLVYDKRLILYSEAYMEGQEPTEILDVNIDTDYRYTDKRGTLYGSCIIERGVFSGKFSTNNGSSKVLRPVFDAQIGSNTEAARFAKNLLRASNKDCCEGFVRSKILPGYAAASTVELKNARAPSWDGAVFLHHIRNDYGAGESKLFFRRPLEGY